MGYHPPIRNRNRSNQALLRNTVTIINARTHKIMAVSYGNAHIKLYKSRSDRNHRLETVAKVITVGILGLSETTRKKTKTFHEAFSLHSLKKPLTRHCRKFGLYVRSCKAPYSERYTTKFLENDSLVQPRYKQMKSRQVGRGGKSPSPQKVLSHCVDRVTASPRCSPIASFSRIGTKDPPQWFVTTPAPRKMHGPRLLCLLSLVFLLRGAFPEAVSRALSSTGIPEFALLPLVICAVQTPCV